MTINSNSSISGGASASFSHSSSLLNSINVVPTASKINVSGNAANDVDYSFKEDVVEEIQENLKEFKDCIAALKKIDLKDDIHDTIYLYSFVSNMNKLYRVMRNLSVSFADFQDLDVEISKNLPNGPNDDSELS